MMFCDAYAAGADFMEMTEMVIFQIGKYKRFLAENGYPPNDGMEVTDCDGNVVGFVPNNELIKILENNGVSLL